jgi:hypothetical protein
MNQKRDVLTVIQYIQTLHRLFDPLGCSVFPEAQTASVSPNEGHYLSVEYGESCII